MLRKLLIGIVVVSFLAFPITAAANSNGHPYHNNLDFQLSLNADVTFEMVSFIHSQVDCISLNVDVDVESYDEVIPVRGIVMAEVKNVQGPEKNVYPYSKNLTNTAQISGNVLTNFSGNLGANDAAGDSNTQSNIAAISVGEQANSMTEATILSEQVATKNFVEFVGTRNFAYVKDNSLSGSSGNFGLNVAAGNNNAQSNMVAIAVAPARVALASAIVQQKSYDNVTINRPSMKCEEVAIPVDLTFTLTNSEAVNGNLYQSDNYYLDQWTGALPHPNGTEAGHVDVDYAIQNATENPNKPGVGGLGFDSVIPAGEIVLTGTVVGNYPAFKWVVDRNVDNRAEITGNALTNVTGNLGINVAAGTNNLQANALSVCYLPEISTPTPTPPNGTEP